MGSLSKCDGGDGEVETRSGDGGEVQGTAASTAAHHPVPDWAG